MAGKAYFDEHGMRLPSVTTIIGRFKDSGNLLYWANKVGREGMTLDEARKPAADAGTIAHGWVEDHINKRPLREVRGDPDVISKGRAAYEAYLTWQAMTKLEIRHTEVSLSSHTHRFGGTLDAIGMVASMSNGLALVDWKSSNSVYADYLYQMAAYSILWEESYPDHAITGGFHLCRFSKENGDFAHHHFPSLDWERKTFLIMRELYDRVKKTEKRVR